jgi:hypothetical protein
MQKSGGGGEAPGLRSAKRERGRGAGARHLNRKFSDLLFFG